MARLSLDDVAWTSRWRDRSVAEKAWLSTGLLLCAVSAQRLAVAVAVALASAVAALGFARVPARALGRAVAGPALFVAVGVAAVVLSVGASPAGEGWSWGPFAVTTHSLDRGVDVASRSIAAVCALLLLASTTPMTDLLSSARRTGLPAELLDVAAVTYRMIFLLLDSQAGIRESQSARLGYATRSAAYRSLGALGAATLMRAWTRARALEAGLAGRGYDGSLRTVGRERPVSWAFVAASSAVVLPIAALSISAAGA